jgi:hypothetical protein
VKGGKGEKTLDKIEVLGYFENGKNLLAGVFIFTDKELGNGFIAADTPRRRRREWKNFIASNGCRPMSLPSSTT